MAVPCVPCPVIAKPEVLTNRERREALLATHPACAWSSKVKAKVVVTILPGCLARLVTTGGAILADSRVDGIRTDHARCAGLEQHAGTPQACTKHCHRSGRRFDPA